MAVLIRTQMRTYLNLLIGDVSATNPELSETRKNALLDEWHAWVWEAFGPRLLQIPHTASGFITIVDSGLTLQNGFSTFTARTDIAELLSLHHEGTTATAQNGTILDRISLAELLRRRAKSTTAGTPVAACWFRNQSLSGSPVGTNNGRWRILVHPPVGATAQYFSVNVRREVTALANDSDAPDVTPMESRLIVRGAAAEACYRIGRNGRAKYVTRLLPDVMKAALDVKLEIDRQAA